MNQGIGWIRMGKKGSIVDVSLFDGVKKDNESDFFL